ncbi:hypothetical protein [Chloroflexus sp.]|uniref:hypothetical protein n=1 Tax=Chloroflexus sp. TaxID=1904827 RepID=UPI002ACEB0B6|nr:hypothetical protein [Chloroflexus sp.]
MALFPLAMALAMLMVAVMVALQWLIQAPGLVWLWVMRVLRWVWQPLAESPFGCEPLLAMAARWVGCCCLLWRLYVRQ